MLQSVVCCQCCASCQAVLFIASPSSNLRRLRDAIASKDDVTTSQATSSPGLQRHHIIRRRGVLKRQQRLSSGADSDGVVTSDAAASSRLPLQRPRVTFSSPLHDVANDECRVAESAGQRLRRQSSLLLEKLVAPFRQRGNVVFAHQLCCCYCLLLLHQFFTLPMSPPLAKWLL